MTTWRSSDGTTGPGTVSAPTSSPFLEVVSSIVGKEVSDHAGAGCVESGAVGGDDIPSDVASLADDLLALGTDDGLVDMARQAIGGEPDEPGYWLELAKVLRQRGEYDAALRVYDTAGWRFAELPQLWNNRGFLLTQWGRLAEAIMSFDRALSLDSDYVVAVEGKGHALEVAGLSEDAELVYRTVLARTRATLTAGTTRQLPEGGRRHRQRKRRVRARALHSSQTTRMRGSIWTTSTMHTSVPSR